jgi:streptogramin lyase
MVARMGGAEMGWRGRLLLGVATAVAVCSSVASAGAAPEVRYYGAEAGDGAESIAVGVDGALWVRAFGNTIERVTPSGRKRVFRVPGLPEASGGSIAAGADGALWFNEDTATCSGRRARFGRITTAGHLSHVVVPRLRGEKEVSFSGPVQGPDGNMWFAGGLCDGGGVIGRIAPRGQVRQWRVGFFPQVIVRGPDRQMWFAPAFSNRKAVSISMAGKVTRRRLTLALFVTRGPGAAFWAPVDGGILRQRVNGRTRLYPYPPGDPTNETAAVAPGPHNDIWFARDHDEQTSAEAGSIDPDGKIETVPIGDGRGSPTDVTAAPDGSVWIAQFYGPLARISVEHPTPTRSPRVHVLHDSVRGRRATVNLRCEGLLGTFCSDTLTLRDRSGRVVGRPRRFTIAAQDKLNITKVLSAPPSGREIHADIRRVRVRPAG